MNVSAGTVLATPLQTLILPSKEDKETPIAMEELTPFVVANACVISTIVSTCLCPEKKGHWI